jgi:hypothetical protein
MSRLQSFAIGLVMAAIGIAAILQVSSIDVFWKTISLEALGAVSILGAMVFFLGSFRGR